MPIEYETFMKHAAKVTKSEVIKEKHILQGVNHLENGDAVVTDSHRLYLAKGIHSKDEQMVLSPTGKRNYGDYPDVSRLIPSNAPAQRVILKLKDALHAADAIYSVGSLVEKNVAAEFNEQYIKCKTPQFSFQYEFPVMFDFKIWLNAGYLLDAVKMFKEEGCEVLQFNFYSSMRPMTITNEDESLIALILPIRKY